MTAIPAPAVDLSRRDTTALDARLDRISRRRRGLPPPTALVRSPGGSYHYGDQQTPFHAASVGKLATAALAGQFIDEGLLAPDTAVAEILGPELDGLFTVAGRDHAGTVTVEHLLTHTAGCDDYFEGRTHGGPRFQKFLTGDPDRFWTPTDVLAFARTYQRARSIPGHEFRYSDTGFTLLGLLLERVGGAPFHELLDARILTPLQLSDTYLAFRSGRDRPIAPFWLGRAEASTWRAVSCDWAGGGIVTTPADLARFTGALFRGQVVSPATRDWLSRPRHRFRSGLRYGAGTMEVRFEEFFFLLRGLPRLRGHLGILATHAWYDPDSDTEIVLNFHSTRQLTASFRFLTALMQTLRR